MKGNRRSATIININPASLPSLDTKCDRSLLHAHTGSNKAADPDPLCLSRTNWQGVVSLAESGVSPELPARHPSGGPEKTVTVFVLFCFCAVFSRGWSQTPACNGMWAPDRDTARGVRLTWPKGQQQAVGYCCLLVRGAQSHYLMGLSSCPPRGTTNIICIAAALGHAAGCVAPKRFFPRGTWCDTKSGHDSLV